MQHVLLQAAISHYIHSSCATSRFVWLFRNHGKFLSSVTVFKRRYSEKAMSNFIEGRQVILTLNWQAENFSPSQQEKNYKDAVANLIKALSVEINDGPSTISNKNMEPVISQALESQDLSIVEDKLEWCLDSNKFPSFPILKALALLSVESKHSQCVSTIRNAVKAGYPMKYLQSARLLLYASEVSWRNGNIIVCLNCLQKLFKEFPFAKSEGRYLLSRIIAEAVKFRGESNIVLLTNYAQSLVDNEQDYFSITVLWYYLFVSEWFIDHQAAGALLEKNKSLKSNITYLIEYVARKFLRSNNIPDVLRLLEFLLKHELHLQYSTVQSELFNYHYFRGNIRACTEIYKSSVALNLPLTENQRNRYTSLVLKLDDDSFQKLVQPKSLKLKF